MDKVCCIMDVDGFDKKVCTNGLTYRNKFLVRELAYIGIDKKQDFLPISHRFDLRSEIDLNRISIQERQTLNYQSRKVTGLTVLPARDEVVRDYSDLERVVRGMHSTLRQSGADVVAYKGGNKEKELLEGYGIPCLDLGSCGCPSYEKLVQEGRVYSTVRDCGHHKLHGGGMVHCPMAEVVVFRDWYMLNYRKYERLEDASDNSSSEEDWN